LTEFAVAAFAVSVEVIESMSFVTPITVVDARFGVIVTVLTFAVVDTVFDSPRPVAIVSTLTFAVLYAALA